MGSVWRLSFVLPSCITMVRYGCRFGSEKVSGAFGGVGGNFVPAQRDSVALWWEIASCAIDGNLGCVSIRTRSSRSGACSACGVRRLVASSGGGSDGAQCLANEELSLAAEGVSVRRLGSFRSGKSTLRRVSTT